MATSTNRDLLVWLRAQVQAMLPTTRPGHPRLKGTHGEDGAGRLARLFDDVELAGSFSAQLLAPAHMLELEVSGVGPVRLPVRAPLAKKLIAVARPAMFGRGEATLADTGELTPDQLMLGGAGWTALLEHFRDELGLPRTSRLRAEPYAMLVYGKGQFFLPQDSEKHDAMVGTLVVSLPSTHTGGELVIDHAGRWRRTAASTCTPRSTRPGSRCGTRPDGRAGHTRSCSRKPTNCSQAPPPRDTPPRPTWRG